LSEQYFEEKAKEFNELRLGTLTMKELCSKFLSLLRYVPYLVDEKPKVLRFISCLPPIYRDRIEYDNPRTLEEAMRKANFCFDQNKNRREAVPSWRNKKNNNYEHRKAGFKPNKNFNNSRNFPKGNFQGNTPKNIYQQNFSATKNKDTPKNNEVKPGVPCYTCQGPHYAKDCPQNQHRLNAVQDEVIVGDVATRMPAISAALENRQAHHQTAMVEIEGTLNEYISPPVYQCHLYISPIDHMSSIMHIFL